MTTLVAALGGSTPPSATAKWRLNRPPPGVLLAGVVVIAVRLPFLHGWPGKDEAGYLDVAQQWHARGSSLYENYWVDRPPLLIAIYRAAALLGGVVPLRLIGIVAAVVTVLAVGHAAEILAGRRAATWGAITAAALLVSPQTGAIEVNGELLAAPFIAIGIAASITMLATTSPHRALRASALAGASGLLAVLVKQNMLDVIVFAGVLVLLRLRAIGTTRLAIVVGGFLSGAVLAGASVAIWTVAHGTSLSGVWFAMYQFRTQADAVIAATPHNGVFLRGLGLIRDVVLSGTFLLVALLLVNVLRRRRDQPADEPVSTVARLVPLALLATFAYEVTSIYLGGNYWSHYLVQLVVPLALSAGLAGAHRPRTSGLVIAVLAVASAWAATTLVLHPTGPGGNRLGIEIAAVAQPADTIVTIWGHADVTHASGLTSPYPYLWALPAQTLDPHAHLLTSVLTSADAPTWFVTWSGTGLHGADATALKTVLHDNFSVVAKLRGHTIYLRNGVVRSAPTARTIR